MARSTPTIPISTIPSVDPKFSISNEDWQRIESAYGHAVPPDAREQIHGVMFQFLQFDEAEQRARPVSETQKRVERIKKAAAEFQKAVFEQEIGRDARIYANSLIKRHLKDARIRKSK